MNLLPFQSVFLGNEDYSRQTIQSLFLFSVFYWKLVSSTFELDRLFIPCQGHAFHQYFSVSLMSPVSLSAPSSHLTGCARFLAAFQFLPWTLIVQGHFYFLHCSVSTLKAVLHFTQLSPILRPPDVAELISNSLEMTLMLGKIEGRRRRGRLIMRWLDCITNSIDMNSSKLQEIAKDSEARCAAAQEVTKSRTWCSYWTATGSSYKPLSWLIHNTEQIWRWVREKNATDKTHNCVSIA